MIMRLGRVPVWRWWWLYETNFCCAIKRHQVDSNFNFSPPSIKDRFCFLAEKIFFSSPCPVNLFLLSIEFSCRVNLFLSIEFSCQVNLPLSIESAGKTWKPFPVSNLSRIFHSLGSALLMKTQSCLSPQCPTVCFGGGWTPALVSKFCCQFHGSVNT